MPALEIGNESARVVITRSSTDLTVAIHGGRQGPPVVGLIPAVPGSPVLFASAEFDESAHAWIARFEQPPPDALLVFGP